MAWYGVKLSDGSEHRLWFGHDPSEADVLESLKAPKAEASKTSLPDRPDTPEVGVGGSPLQRVMGTEADPNSPEVMAKALILGASAPGGPLAGGIARGGNALLRAATAPPVVAGGTGAALGALESGGNLKHTLAGGAGGVAAAYGLPLVGQGITKLAGKAISSALSARLAHTLAREAPEAVSAIESALIESGASRATARGVAAAEMAGAGKAVTGEVSGNLPGVVKSANTPLKMPAIALAEDIQAQVATLRASGLSQAQVTAAVREAHNLEADAAKKVVSTIFEHGGGRVAATAEALPTGSKVMPPYRGGKAQPYSGPARVPTNDADLQQLLQQSLDAYKIP